MLVIFIFSFSHIDLQSLFPFFDKKMTDPID